MIDDHCHNDDDDDDKNRNFNIFKFSWLIYLSMTKNKQTTTKTLKRWMLNFNNIWYITHTHTHTLLLVAIWCQIIIEMMWWMVWWCLYLQIKFESSYIDLFTDNYHHHYYYWSKWTCECEWQNIDSHWHYICEPFLIFYFDEKKIKSVC